jgi:hypothetical protein
MLQQISSHVIFHNINHSTDRMDASGETTPGRKRDREPSSSPSNSSLDRTPTKKVKAGTQEVATPSTIQDASIESGVERSGEDEDYEANNEADTQVNEEASEDDEEGDEDEVNDEDSEGDEGGDKDEDEGGGDEISEDDTAEESSTDDDFPWAGLARMMGESSNKEQDTTPTVTGNGNDNNVTPLPDQFPAMPDPDSNEAYKIPKRVQDQLAPEGSPRPRSLSDDKNRAEFWRATKKLMKARGVGREEWENGLFEDSPYDRRQLGWQTKLASSRNEDS